MPVAAAPAAKGAAAGGAAKGAADAGIAAAGADVAVGADLGIGGAISGAAGGLADAGVAAGLSSAVDIGVGADALASAAGDIGAGAGTLAGTAGDIGLEGGALSTEAAAAGGEAVAAPAVEGVSAGAAGAAASPGLGGFIAPEAAAAGDFSGIGAVTGPAALGSSDVGLGGLSAGLGDELGGAGLVGDVTGGAGIGGDAAAGIGEAGGALGGGADFTGAAATGGLGDELGGAGLVGDVTGTGAAAPAASIGDELGGAGLTTDVTGGVGVTPSVTGDIAVGASPSDIAAANADFALSPGASDALGAGTQLAAADTSSLTDVGALSGTLGPDVDAPALGTGTDLSSGITDFSSVPDANVEDVFDTGAAPLDNTFLTDLQGNIVPLQQPTGLGPGVVGVSPTPELPPGTLTDFPGGTIPGGTINPLTPSSPLIAPSPNVPLNLPPGSFDLPAAPGATTAVPPEIGTGAVPAGAGGVVPGAAGGAVPGLANPMGAAAGAGAATAAGVEAGTPGATGATAGTGAAPQQTLSNNPTVNALVSQNAPAIQQIAQQNGWASVPGGTFTPQNIAKLVQQETGGANSPANAHGYEGYFQMRPADFGLKPGAFTQMSFQQQLDFYANHYLAQYHYNGTQDLGVMNAAPSLAGQPDNTIAFKAGSAAARANPQWVRFSNANGAVTIAGIKAWFAAGGPTGTAPATSTAVAAGPDTLDMLLANQQINPQGLATTPASPVQSAAVPGGQPLETTPPTIGPGIGGEINAPLTGGGVGSEINAPLTGGGIGNEVGAPVTGGGVGGEINAPLNLSPEAMQAVSGISPAPAGDVFSFTPSQVEDVLSGPPGEFQLGEGSFPQPVAEPPPEALPGTPTTPVETADLGPAQAPPETTPPEPAQPATPPQAAEPPAQPPAQPPAETPPTPPETVPPTPATPPATPPASATFTDWWKGLNPWVRAAIVGTPSLLMSAYRLAQAQMGSKALQAQLAALEAQANQLQSQGAQQLALAQAGQIPPDQEAAIQQWLRDMDNAIRQQAATAGTRTSTMEISREALAAQQAEAKRAGIISQEFANAQQANNAAAQDLTVAAGIQQQNEANFNNALTSLFTGLGGIAVRGALVA